MTPDRNGLDGLTEVMGLLGKATPGEWQATVEVFDKGGWAAPFQHITVYTGEELITTYSTDYAEYPDDKQNTANAGAYTAAVNYLRSHGEAIRELVEAVRQYRNDYHTEGCADPSCGLCSKSSAAETRLTNALRPFTPEGK